MGGAVSADTTDFSANYYNPAGLAGEMGVRLSLGYTYNWQNLKIDAKDSGVDSVHGLVFGVAAGGKVFGVPIALGIATHLPDQGISRVTALREGVVRWELYDSRASVLYLTANLAVRPVSWMELGGGVSFLAATHGRFEVTGTADILQPYNSKLRHEVDADLTSVRYPEVGARFHLGDRAALALVYRHETKLDLELSALLRGNVDFAGVKVPILYTLTSKTVAAFLPAQLVVGTSLRVTKGLHVNADLTYLHWSGYASPTARTAAKLTATPPAGLDLDLPKEIKPTEPIAPHFQDRVVPRIGIEWLLPWPREGALFRATVRGGYVFEKSPVPPQTGVTNFVDTDRHTFTLGAGVCLDRPPFVNLDLHFLYSVLPERTTLKASAADLVGDYRQSGSMVGVGTTLGAAFR
jgi:long-chain fatty acid transport protein